MVSVSSCIRCKSKCQAEALMIAQGTRKGQPGARPLPQSQNPHQSHNLGPGIHIVVRYDPLRRLPQQQDGLGSVQVILHGSVEAISQECIFAAGSFAYKGLHLSDMCYGFCSYLQVSRETLPWVAIMVVEYGDANGIGAVVFEQVADEREVTQ